MRKEKKKCKTPHIGIFYFLIFFSVIEAWGSFCKILGQEIRPCAQANQYVACQAYETSGRGQVLELSVEH